MAKSQVLLTYLGTNQFPLDLTLSLRKYFRHTFNAGDPAYDCTASATATELANNSVMAALLDPARVGGPLFSMSVVPLAAPGYEAPTVTPGTIAVESGNVGIEVTMRIPVVAASSGAASDIVIPVPFKCRPVSTRAIISTLSTTAGVTMQLWSAAGGTGVPLSGAIACGSANALGVVSASGGGFTASAVVAAGGNLYLRRSSKDDVAGEVFIVLFREP